MTMTDTDPVAELRTSLPDDYYDRHTELKRRKRDRGLIDTDQKLIIKDAEQVSTVSKPITEASADEMREQTKRIEYLGGIVQSDTDDDDDTDIRN